MISRLIAKHTLRFIPTAELPFFRVPFCGRISVCLEQHYRDRAFSSLSTYNACDTHPIIQAAAREYVQPASSVEERELEPGLYLVATPIGNLEDITLRALRVLKSASVILAEDTRHSQKLLSFHGIQTRTVSFHEHNEREKESKV